MTACHRVIDGGPKSAGWEAVNVGKPGPRRVSATPGGANCVDIYKPLGLYPVAVASGTRAEGAGWSRRFGSGARPEGGDRVAMARAADGGL